ncbi:MULTISPECIES: hypothetical protein [unclassified Brevundimonas]|uniref:hypothetical protein n=1 Tax=unclassified Brevundimonas TaxID=2622653 RepID=UPI0025BA5426|nr:MULTISPECIES: hypothetical protein [unclassified Brevundimonas]
MIALVSALALLAAQAAPSAAGPVSIAPTDIEVKAPAVASPNCGGLLSTPAFCVTARMDQLGDIADAYVEDLKTKGWIPADGDDNRIILIKRREGGGCDGMQMVAFFDTSKPQVAEEPAYLAFALIPGNVCSASEGSNP